MGRLFDTLLVANRGEIACRVMRTCKRLGIRTVGIYSEPDARAPHVAMADTAVCVGPAASTASYLNIEAIMRAIETTGAQAVHPGYGFLSENAAFSEAVEAAGVAFVGPAAYAMRAMGDKIESKKVAAAAGVSTIPGFMGVLKDEDEAVAVAAQVGYPVMIKASAGGGGKGMRIAYNEAETRSGFRTSSAEAASSFGDDRIFIERFVEEPRHIEIQLVADAHGGCVYLPERECSIQRRNQKVLEEAPAAHLSAEAVRKMGEEAVALAKAVGYRSAGTVEFLVDKREQHYFLEMNTRLQVEHPVTELVTGLDLVEVMVRVAAGEHLNLDQEEVRKPKGWAMEARVYAEDPLRGFLPSTGTLSTYSPPAEGVARAGGTVRVDAGVREGSEISMFYDPMIAKLCTHGADREQARLTMVEALDRYAIGGVRHNINFLRTLNVHERFVAAQLTTHFIPDEFPDGYSGHVLSESERLDLVSAAAALQLGSDEQARSGSGEEEEEYGIELSVRLEEGEHELVVQREDEETVRVFGISGGGAAAGEGASWQRELLLNSSGLGPSRLLEAEVADEAAEERELTVQVVAKKPLGWTLRAFGTEYELLARRPRVAELASYMKPPPKSAFSGALLSPMPGRLVSMAVEVGDEVAQGQELAVVEAMKMQNVLLAERDGVVSSLLAEPGATLETDQPLIAFEA